MISFTSLRERFLADRHGGGALPGLAAALTAIGWRAVGEPSPEELASYLVELVEACVTDHHDTELLVDAVARLLRDSGPLLDGGLPPVAAYEPAAREVVERYVRGEARRVELPFTGG
ncbi:hypothetical protein J421_5259 (plasmid) [Gemmatirosa kalamazoonensis]|uniref:Uncharacterized protein n=1 Tax=Gemmatirosa kalamazoonensis TaxID=861299 RepID=W0RP68_9BACT|nr:hypothetical protein [Gemmatirosa kalamazoonensis]AHG92794.1 hypothetical protein J421_5259 [Gemmatirosa kalamazoonensis]